MADKKKVPSGVTEETGGEKLFSQAELDAIVQHRVKGYKEKVDTLEKEKSDLEASNSDLTSKLEDLEQSNSLSKLGVPEDFTEFVMFKAKKLAVDGKSIEDAIKEVVKKNKSILGIKSTKKTSGEDDADDDDTTNGNADKGGADDSEDSDEGDDDNEDKANAKRTSTKVSKGTQGGSADTDVDDFLKRKGLVK